LEDLELKIDKKDESDEDEMDLVKEEEEYNVIEYSGKNSFTKRSKRKEIK